MQNTCKIPKYQNTPKILKYIKIFNIFQNFPNLVRRFSAVFENFTHFPQYFLIDLENCRKMLQFPSKSASIQPIFQHFKAQMYFGILEVFWYFGHHRNQTENTRCLHIKFRGQLQVLEKDTQVSLLFNGFSGIACRLRPKKKENDTKLQTKKRFDSKFATVPSVH